jgi:histidyl-tRNA synthetase
LCEVELIRIFDTVLGRLGLPAFHIHLNNRKVLAGIAEVAGVTDRLTDLTVAIDKLDKIGRVAVEDELRQRQFSELQITALDPLFHLEGTPHEVIQRLKTVLSGSEVGRLGLEELEEVMGYILDYPLTTGTLVVDPTLARGLNYYTGAIFEVKVPNSPVGSICGGGRYDDLTGIFGMPGLSGVGISFGADRIYDVLEAFELFPARANKGTQVMFVNFGADEARVCFGWVEQLRDLGIRAELYPDAAKLKKQMKYADDKAIPFVALAGTDEIQKGQITLKNMVSGTQVEVAFHEIAALIDA